MVQKKLDLERELLEADKKNHRRTTFLQSVVSETAEHQHEQEQLQRERDFKQLKDRYETELEEWKLKYQKEQEDNKMQILTWELRFQQQDDAIRQGQQEALGHTVALQQLQKDYQDSQQQQLALQQGRNDDRAKHLEEIHELKEQQKAADEKQQEVAAVRHKEEVDELNQQLNSLRDQVMRMNSLMADMREKMILSKGENERYAMHTQELEDKCEELEDKCEELEKKCKELGDHRGDDVKSPRHHPPDGEDDAVDLDESVAKGRCPHCKEFEEEIYELEIKLNKLQIESQKRVDPLKERTSGKMIMPASSKDERVIEALSTAAAAIPAAERGIKSGKEQQVACKVATDQAKTNMNVLAFAAKQESSDRERCPVEQELKRAKKNTSDLELEFEDMRNEPGKDHATKQESCDRETSALEQALQEADKKILDLSLELEQVQHERAKEIATKQELFDLEICVLVQELQEAKRNKHDMALQMEELPKEQEKELAKKQESWDVEKYALEQELQEAKARRQDNGSTSNKWRRFF